MENDFAVSDGWRLVIALFGVMTAMFEQVDRRAEERRYQERLRERTRKPRG